MSKHPIELLCVVTNEKMELGFPVRIDAELGVQFLVFLLFPDRLHVNCVLMHQIYFLLFCHIVHLTDNDTGSWESMRRLATVGHYSDSRCVA